MLGIEQVLSKPVNASLLFDTMMHLANLELEMVPAEPPPPVLVNLSSIRGARVLLVEDNEVNQQVASEMLAGAGLQVDIANHGAECLTMLDQGRYDLVLMDMQMPVMNGLQATETIRAGGRHPDLPIVAMTANVLAEDRERCQQAGMNDFISKPIEPEALWAMLLRWIAPRAAGGELAAPLRQAVATSTGMPAIDGLDTAAGLRRVLGKQAAYSKMLQTFVRDQGDLAARLAERLALSDRTGAAALLHTLRGVAGNIGAVRVQTLAQQMEQALAHETAAELLPRQQALGSALERVLAGIAAALPAVAAPPPLPALAAPDRQLLASVCPRLLALLADNDSQAENLAQEHAALLRAAFGVAAATGMEAALEQFDFEQAHALLAQAWQSSQAGAVSAAPV